jgi:outer membrane protein assembly factor BamD
MHNGQIHGLRIEGAGLGRQVTAHLDLISHLDLGGRAGLDPAIDLHGAVVNELLNEIAGEIGQQGRQSLVQPLPMTVLPNADLARKQSRAEPGSVILQIVVPVRYGIGSYNFVADFGTAHYRLNAKVNSMMFAGLSTARIVLLIAALPALLAGCASEPKDPTAGWSPNKIYAEARDEASSGAFEKAVTLFEKLEGRAAGTPLAQQAQLEKAYAHYRAGEAVQAIAALDRFMRLHPSSPAIDYALYLKGLANFNENLGLFGRLARKDLSESDQKAAKESFESFKELVTRFPDSKYAPDAQLRMTYVVNSIAQSEVNVARYYHSRGAYIAAINRAQTALNEFRDVPAHEEALFILYRSYEALGMTDLRDDALRVMRRTYPNSTYLGGSASGASKRPWYRLW